MALMEGHDARVLEPAVWRADGECSRLRVPPDVFYPDTALGVRDAKALCRRCAVSLECLTWAIRNSEDDGIWGGVTVAGRIALAALVNGEAR